MEAPKLILANDTVFINHNVTLIDNIDIQGVLKIESSGLLDGDKTIDTDISGTLINNGEINITKGIGNDGEIYNNGYLRAQKYHDGYTCNTDTIELDNGEKYDCHGCTLECNGTIVSCEIKTHDNAGGSFIDATNFCCDDGNDPSWDIKDNTTIDSSNVFNYGVALDGSTALPIQLLYFDGKAANPSLNNLPWRTTSEINNNYFTIEKSSNHKNWLEISKIFGSGNSLTIKDYYYNDYDISNDTLYYRLK